MDRRINLVSITVVVCIGLLLTVMLGRVVQLQMRPSEQLQAVRDDRVSKVDIPGVRGDILDRRGRPLAITRFGHRIFVDPLRLPKDVGPVFEKLAVLSALPMDKVVERLIPALDKNDRIMRDPAAPLDANGRPKGLSHYVTLGGIQDDSIVAQVKAQSIPGVFTELRSVRETPADDLAASLVGLVGIDHDGLLGAEFFLDKKIRPTQGSITYVRDSRSRPLWLAPGGYVAPQRGDDIRLSIDLELQNIAIDELRRGVEEADAAGGRLVIMDPATGEVLAMVDVIRHVSSAEEYPWTLPGDRTPLQTGRRYRTIRDDVKRDAHPSAARNRCVEDVYEPGSTFKPFMWSTTTELGLAHPDEIFNTEHGHWNCYGSRTLSDVVLRETQTWSEVLINSSNIGMAKGTARMSFQQMRDAVVRFGFGAKTNIGLPGESPGIVTPLRRWSKYSHTSVAMGHEVAVTPVQMVRAFSAFARQGDLAGTIPGVHFTAVDSATVQKEAKRAILARTAELTRKTMHGVTQKVDDKAFRDASGQVIPPKYDWFGKSGTAEIPVGKAPKGYKRPTGSDGYYRGQYNSSFIAGAPLESPRLVVVAVIDDPGPGLIAQKHHYGSWVAGPVVRRVMERALPYLGVKPTVAPLETVHAGTETPAH
ncbi:MAG: penicillin-binding protein 2 [Pyrinomonadaceae bacterium]|nr:penicillin-binding protein 2 [Phycisphaerales bacterium]